MHAPDKETQFCEYARRLAVRFSRWLEPGWDKDDFIQESVCCAWEAYKSWERRGGRPDQAWRALARFGRLRALSGRRFVGRPPKGRSWRSLGGRTFRNAGRRTVESSSPRLPGKLYGPARQVADAIDGRGDNPAEVAAVRVDFANWARGLNHHRARVLALLIEGANSTDVARALGINLNTAKRMRWLMANDFQAYLGK